MRKRWMVVLLAGACSAQAAMAQQVGPEADNDPSGRSEQWELGGGGLFALPLGEFADHVGPGGGFYLSGVLYPGEQRRLGIRLDGILISYGSTTVRRPLDPVLPFGEVDVTTENAIGSFSVGPQLTVGHGRWRSFVHASIGTSQFVTTTSVWGSGGPLPVASTENFERYTLLLSAGSGVRVMFRRERRHPVSVDLGGSYLRHGQTEYLREGSIQALPNGEVAIEVLRSATNLASARLGMTIGFR